MSEAKQVITTSGIGYADNLEDCINGVDAILLVTRWDAFRGLASVLSALGQDPLVVDGRRMLEPGEFENYIGVGQ